MREKTAGEGPVGAKIEDLEDLSKIQAEDLGAAEAK